MRFATLPIAFMLVGCIGTSTRASGGDQAARAAEELLSADRRYSAASASTDLVTGISAMFAPDVMVPTPGGRFARGTTEAIAAMRMNPDNPRSKATWVPVRAGVSADGLHGFTLGYMTIEKPDKSQVPAKYLAYWVKGAHGWRVAAYKRSGRAAGNVSLTLLAPSLPSTMVSQLKGGSSVTNIRSSLDAAERAFSNAAQDIGLGPAFAKFGAPDAMHFGGPDDIEFLRGPEAIAKSVSAGSPEGKSPVSWAPDTVIVASSGDLGVSIGLIRGNDQPAASRAPGFAFFTIWRRQTWSDPWRYIAE